jgi:ribosome-binding factor A
MAGRRVARLNEQFKRELMDIVRRELRDPRVAAATITEVQVSPDLRRARVYLTAMVGESDRQTVVAGLSAAAPFLRGELGRRLHVRRIPALEFTWDDTLERAQRIDRLLSEVLPAEPQENAGDNDEE